MSALFFYRPEFLWGLLFLGAALLIHLLRRPMARSLDFSTFRFFRNAALKATRMRRLRKLLLLLVRLSAVAMLVALFAQPFDRRDPFSLLHDPHLTVFTWIDRTPSMEYTEADTRAGISLLSQARALADSLQSRLPPSVRHFRYDEAQDGFVLCDPAKPPLDRTRHGPPRLDRVLRAWNESRANCSLPLLVLLSDFQKPTAASLDTMLRRLPMQGPQRIMCVTLSPGPAWNFSVRNAAINDAGKISATLCAQGRSLVSADFTVTLSSIRVDRKPVSLPAGDTAAVTAAVAGNTNGAAGGSVVLNARDPMPFDNIAYFVSRNSGALRTVIVGDRERNFPLAAALAASQNRPWYPLTVKESGAITFDDLDSADVVIINAMNQTSRPLEALFTGQAFLNKTALLALDDNEQGFGADEALLARVTRFAEPLRLTTDATPAAIVLPDTISELWQGFPELRTKEATIYRYGTGLPGTVLLRLDNGTPLATLVAGERNRSLILIATPLGETDANNLCETGFYVAFLDRLLRYAAEKNRIPPDVWTAGFERRNPFYGSGRSALVLNEEGKILERWQAQPSVLFKQPGLYKIVPDREESYWLAVNADPEESRLDYSLPVIPDAAKDNVLILNEKQLLSVLKGHNTFLSYLPWLILVLLLLAEVLLWENPGVMLSAAFPAPPVSRHGRQTRRKSHTP